MIQYLHIRNLALMGEAELEFGPGLTAVTGETGAGKSILLGALSLLSGSRGEKLLIRKGADACEVEAGLSLAEPGPVNSLLAGFGLPLCEDGALILRRVVSRRRMAKVQVNGQLTTLSNLQALGEAWIDFHGPGEPQKLFHERWQRSLLDLFAKAEPQLEAYRKIFRRWREVLEEIDAVRGQEQLDPDELEFLRQQIERIDQADLDSGAVEILERDYNRLSRSQELASLASGLEGELCDDGVAGTLGRLLGEAREMASLDPESAVLGDRLEGCIIELEDLAAEFGRVAGACDFDPEEAAALESRMEVWLGLKRKYGPGVEAVLQRREALAARVASQGDIEGRIEALRAESEEFVARLGAAGEALRKKRVSAAAKLSKKAAKLINDLGFKKARLAIDVMREPEFRDHGDSTCTFRFAPNAGEDLLPLNKIASSGELARVMLALKAVLARVDATPVLVFDEVDANVGGEIARVVGDELASLGKRHQVLCVTHLPQVAAKGDAHFVVTKNQGSGRTVVDIAPVDGRREERVTELARMLGDRSSASARSHAVDLLEG